MRALTALATALAVGLSGCATVPTSSAPVVVDNTVGGDSPASTAAAPAPDRAPEDLVCDYVTASATPTERHAAARQYLTEPGSQAWDDSASTTILSNVACIPTGSDPARPGTTTILLRGDSVGRLSATGAYTPVATTTRYTATLDLRQVDGQWRIDGLPDGVVMKSEDFTSVYRRVPIYFLDPTLTQVVPDPRWVVNDAASLAGRLVDLLLAGPRSELAPAVVTELPDRAGLRLNVSKVADGEQPGAQGRGVVVDFADLRGLDVQQRALLAAQVVWTLDGAGVVGPYFLLADGAPLDDEHTNGWTSGDVVATDPAADPGASVPLHAVLGGALVQVDATTISAVPGPLGASTTLTTAALSPDGSRVAGVATTATGVQLLVGAAGQGVVRAVAGESLTRPTWSPDSRAAWVVQNGTTVLRVSQDDRTGAVSTQQVDSTALGVGTGPITSLRLSRDGVRAALVVGGVVEVSVVTRGPAGTLALSAPLPIAPTLGTSARTLDWSGSDSLLVVPAAPDRTVVSLSLDGSEMRPLPGNNLTAPVRAVAASPAAQLVGDDRGVWQLTSGDLTGQRIWRLVDGLGGTLGPTAVPVLPG